MITTAAAIKASFALGKLIQKLYSGDPVGAGWVAIDHVSGNASDKAKLRDAERTIERIESKIIKTVIKRFENDDIKVEEWQSAGVRVSVAFDSLDIFDALFEHLEKPDRLPQTWRQSQLWPDDAEFSRERKLFDQLMTIIAMELIAVINDLPGFQIWFVRRVRKEILDQKEINQQVQELLNPGQVNDLEFDVYYRQAISESLDKVELFVEHGTLRSSDKKQSLDIAYVTLQLAADMDPKSRPVTAETLLEGPRRGNGRIIVLGKAGCGKTTLLRWYGLKAAQLPSQVNADDDYWRNRFSSVVSDDWRYFTPFYIRLRDYSSGNLPAPGHFTNNLNLGRDVPQGWTQRILDLGHGLVLIDGLDELSLEMRAQAVEWIRRLMEASSPDNIFIISSRPEAVENEITNTLNLTSYDIRDLTTDGKAQLIKQWHTAVLKELSGIPSLQAELPSKEARLLLEVRNNRSISTLAANPLLCALLCALNRANDESLPENMRELCERSVQMLLRDRDDFQAGLKNLAPEIFRQSDLDLRIFVAQNLAYEMVMRPDSTLSKTEAIGNIKQSLGGPKPCTLASAIDFFNGLRERSNLIRESGQDNVEFVHNDLRDFLASARISDDGMVADLVRHVRTSGREKWQPILLFATGAIDRRKFRNDIISELIRPPNGFSTPDDRDLVLAMRVADQTTVPVPPELANRLQQFQQSLLPVNSVEKISKLAAAGDAAIPYLSYQSNRKSEVNRACVVALAKMTSEEAASRIEAYLDHAADDQFLLEAIADAVGYQAFSVKRNVLDIKSVLQLLSPQTSLVNNSNHPARPYIKDLSPLSRVGEIRELFLQYTAVETLECLEGLTTLHDLYLQGTPIQHLESLSKFRQLRVLFLQDTKVISLDPLSELTWLEVLNLNGTAVCDVEPLASLSTLDTLWLNDTNVFDLAPLADLNSLRKLYISRTKTTDLSPLFGLSNLQMIDITSSQVLPESLLALRKRFPYLAIVGSTL